MAGDSPEAIKKSVRTYLIVFLALLIGTVSTVAVASLEIFDIGERGFSTGDCILGLAIATIKASLVAVIFMHLNHEKKAIYWIFGCGILMAFFLWRLTDLATFDPIYDTFFYSGK